MVALLYPLSLIGLLAHILLWNRGRRAPAVAAHVLACACPLCAAWAGMDFSPSFTMMFLVANLFLCALAEWVALAGRCLGRSGGAVAAICSALSAAGMLLALPSAYIYAVGDDALGLCVRCAAVAGALGAAGIALVRRRMGRRVRLPGIALHWLSLSAACFALGCGAHSPALLPYGAGLLLMFAATLVERRWSLRAALICLGLASASVFSVAPML